MDVCGCDPGYPNPWVGERNRFGSGSVIGACTGFLQTAVGGRVRVCGAGGVLVDSRALVTHCMHHHFILFIV